MPLIWMVSTSLKADSQIYPAEGQSASAISLINLLPHPVRWQNYPAALEAIPLITYLRNTLWLCLFNVIGAILSSSIVAYGFARLEFRGKSALFLLMISTMALPGQVTMIPIFVLFRWLGWYGTYLPLTVPASLGIPSISSYSPSSIRPCRKISARPRVWMGPGSGRSSGVL